jgi:LytS/YehU family sensor histidine kinase
MKWLPEKYVVPAIHVLVWCILIAVPVVIFRGEEENFTGLSHSYFLLSSLFHIGIFYFNAYFLYPKLLRKKTWWAYIPALAALVAVSNLLKLFFLRLDPDFRLTEMNTRIIFFSIVPFILGSIIFRLISDRIRFERLEKEARAERLSAELRFLRSQVSPHFLFNMMANMVALARQKSDILEPSLIRLSELLRYMLYESNREQITLSEEIEHLQNYISLQQLRFGEDVKTEVIIKNNSPELRIEPMLLVPFIENAFKHGIGLVKDPFIRVEVLVSDGKLHFMVSNNYDGENRSKDKNSGIGLLNVRNRMDLLYPGKYRLNITDNNGIFTAQLNLDLS